MFFCILYNTICTLLYRRFFMAIKIACDSSADLGKEFYEKHNVSVMPYIIVLGDKNYLDGETISVEDIYDYVAKTKQLPKTAALNEYMFREFFEKNYSEDGLIYFNLSSKMSSTFENATAASKHFEKVHVVDSLSLSTGNGMLVRYACQLAESGHSYEEIIEKVEARKKYVQASFILDRLDFLHKGGRCSSLQLLGANLLRLHPSIQVNSDGKMVMNKKYRGKLFDIVHKYIDDTLQEYNNPDLSFCFITHTAQTDQVVIDSAIATAKAHGFKEVFETTASATISCHCGKNTIGILYFNDGGHLA